MRLNVGSVKTMEGKWEEGEEAGSGEDQTAGGGGGEAERENVEYPQ